MKKLLIYPALYKNREVIKYNSLIKKYKLEAAVTVNEYNFEISELCGEYPDIKFSSNFEEEIENCDSVLFLDGLKEEHYELYLEKIKYSALKNKEILLTKKLSELLENHKDILKNYTILNSDNACYECINSNIEEKYLKPIDVPIIGVMGLGDYCGKFSCELELRKYFKDYDLLQYGSKNFSSLFGIEELPEFVFDGNISITKRIIWMNDFLYKKTIQQHPDLMIIGIPGAIMPINRKILNNFGEVAFIISQAVIHFDIAILCLYFSEAITAEYLNEYKNCCRYKLNSVVDYFNISNTTFVFDEESNESRIQYMHLDPQVVSNNFPRINKDKLLEFSAESKLNLNNVLEKITEDLTSNPSTF